MKSATRILISTFGSLVGLIGIEHGAGEILQGNAVPKSLMILSWPESAFFRILNGEPAFTIVPNLLITGILASLFSLAYLAWAAWFVQRRRGGLILVLLCVPMFLFGAGIFPPILGILIGAGAAHINAPLAWWQTHLSVSARRLLEIIWPWSFGACLLAWLLMIPGVPALNYFFGVENTDFIFIILACMFGFLILTGIAGFARDIQRKQVSTSRA